MTIADENNDPTDTSVRVAVRIRPQNTREKLQMNQICTSVTQSEPQICIGKDKAFTFDYVFNIASKQDDIFVALGKPLIDGCLEGYNATILAYGQTGSGKTYTMGSGFEISLDSMEVGIIPRAVKYLFGRIENMKSDFRNKGLPCPDFKVVAQFLELYNEELIDLLDNTETKKEKSHIKIHENTGGSIYLTGVSTRLVASLDDTLKCLKDGTMCRTTASTNMNNQSSRSHAIFTLHIKQQRLIRVQSEDSVNVESETDFETLTAKFHFVDLAGSERLKRTGATGDRAKEGISINCGLLALGNVISTLGDKAKRGAHVPYRNSKLTRLLQDSLGGNSQTIMIACISPSDCDFLETLNTLNYANRARNIKNRVTINQDKTSKQLSAMRQQIEMLQSELLEYKQGKRVADGGKDDGFSDLYTENNFLQNENHSLRCRIKALSNTIDSLKARNSQILAEKEAFLWQYKKEGNPVTDEEMFDFEADEVMKVIDKYTREVEELRAKLAEAEAMATVLQRSNFISKAESCRQSHIAMSGEFPNDDAIIDSSLSDSIFIKPHEPKKKHHLEVSDLEIETFNNTSIISDVDLNIASSDIDKDSLNGDIQDSNDEESYDDEDTDTENQDAENYLHHSLATLTTEIDVKKRLISELQAKQKQLNKIRDHYEQQLEMLQTRIKETESERDQVLANLGEIEVNNEERIRKVKQDYEKKLSSLKAELSQLQTAKREHTMMLKSQQRKDQELRLLQKELSELKSLKVQMSKKLREEAKKSREVENVRNKEIVQLRKEKRIADNQIKNLEQEKVRKEIVLKRKQEELESLRKRGQNNVTNLKPSVSSTSSVSSMKQKYAKKISNVPRKIHARRNSLLSKITKSKLDSIDNALKKTIIRRQTINSFENDMNTRVKEREKLSRKLQRLRSRLDDYQKDGRNSEEIVYSMKNISSQIEILQEEIGECQSNILEVEESQLEESVSDIISNCSLEEAQYLLEQIYQIAISKGILAQSCEAKESSLRLQLQTKNQEREQALDMLRIALQHSNVPFDFDGVFANQSEDEDESSDTDLPTAGSGIQPSQQSFSVNVDQPQDSKRLVKRKPATPEELLGVIKTAEKAVLSFSIDNNNNSFANTKKDIPCVQTPTEITQDFSCPLSDMWKEISSTDDIPMNYQISQHAIPKSPKSPCRKPLTWKHPGGSMTTSLIAPKSSSEKSMTGSIHETPPTSPTNFRRVFSQRSHNEDNVFKRLTSKRTSPNPIKGIISNPGKKNCVSTNAPLCCIHVAEGHQKAVLDLDVSQNIMVTGSKDRSAKIWDLHSLTEVDSLQDHQNSVTKVRYCPSDNLIFTVCAFYIKMWDIRDTKNCIRTLWSSGLSQEGPPEFSQTSRQTICPPGENFIMDIAFTSGGNTMFLATANSVKLWDMRRYCAVGKLHGNHQAPVMVLASCDMDRGSSALVTGSKDHYIKVFDVSLNSVGLITPSIELKPPHYDGVESLALHKHILLSGSRDSCIKKWDLLSASCTMTLSQAHRDWIQALCFSSDHVHFVSGCRSGIMKVWVTDNCTYFGDIQAHESGITSIRSSNDLFFSASSDTRVKIWKNNVASES